MARKAHARTYRPQSPLDVIRYVCHATQTGLVTCAGCVQDTDLTARPRNELVAECCARCNAAFGIRGERWWVVPRFAVHAA